MSRGRANLGIAEPDQNVIAILMWRTGERGSEPISIPEFWMSDQLMQNWRNIDAIRKFIEVSNLVRPSIDTIVVVQNDHDNGET